APISRGATSCGTSNRVGRVDRPGAASIQATAELVVPRSIPIRTGPDPASVILARLHLGTARTERPLPARPRRAGRATRDRTSSVGNAVAGAVQRVAFADVQFELPPVLAIPRDAPELQRADLRHVALDVDRDEGVFLSFESQGDFEGAQLFQVVVPLLDERAR